MKKKKNKSNLFKLPEIKKDITTFLTSEEGKVTKKKIITGALTLTMLGIAMDSLAGHSSHGSSNQSRLHNSASLGRHLSHAVHSSHGSHNSW
jgi:hypothetical protein